MATNQAVGSSNLSGRAINSMSYLSLHFGKLPRWLSENTSITAHFFHHVNFLYRQIQFYSWVEISWSQKWPFWCLCRIIAPIPSLYALAITLSPDSGRIDPVISALTIFLILWAAQTSENSPATLSLPRTLNRRKPPFLIWPNTGSTIVLRCL